MTIKLSVPAKTELHPKITVVGVGGAGGNAVNNMIAAELEGVDFIVANTDAQSLAQALTDRRIQLGVGVTQGLGAGSKPEIGRRAAEESLNEVMESLHGAHMVFITAGMGGGTGTGAAPVIAQACREAGILTVGVVTKPFHFEGSHRMVLAEAGIKELEAQVDTLIIIPNQNLFRVANEKTTFADAFKMADDVLYSGVRGVTDLMVMPGLINLDFADVRTVMMEMGKAMMGTGEAEGDKRSILAAEAAISNPLLDDVSMKGARGVLINITGGPDMTLYEVDEAATRIREEVDPNANIIFGSIFDESLKGRVRVSVVATGIGVAAEAAPKVHTLYPEAGQPVRPMMAGPAPAAPAFRPITAGGPAPATARVMPAAPAPLVVSASHPVAELKTMDQIAPAPMLEMPEPMVEAAPVVAEAAPTAVAQPMMEAKAPAFTARPLPLQPAVTAAARPAAESFVAPRPQEPRARQVPLAKPEPFAEAAVANAGAAPQPPRKKARGPSLFERMTGVGRRAEVETTPAAPAPQASGIRVEPMLEARQAAPRPAEARKPETAPVQAERLAPQPEEDLLEIPAFLRRQAN